MYLATNKAAHNKPPAQAIILRYYKRLDIPPIFRPMSVNVLTFGLNHASAPVSVRERVAMPVEVCRAALDALRAAFGGAVKEAAILSTCNRTELYCAAAPQAAERLPQWLADVNQIDAQALTPHLYPQ